MTVGNGVRHGLAVAVGAVAASIGFVTFLVGALWMAFIGVSASTYCERGDSNYGALTWSKLPPGPVCTWSDQTHGGASTTGPTPVMSVWIIVMILLGVVAVIGFRSASAHGRSHHSPDSHEARTPVSR